MLSTALGWHALRKTAGFAKLSSRDQLNEVKSYASGLREWTHERLVEQHLNLLVRTLARPLGLHEHELRDRILKGPSRGEVVIDDEIPMDTAYFLKDLVAENHLAGIIFRSETQRSYTMPDLAAHTIGYLSEKEVSEGGKVRQRNVAVTGIEKAYDEWLTGIDGQRVEYLDVRGLPVRGAPDSLDEPRNGHNVQTTLDSQLQAVVEDELRRVAMEAKVQRGTIIMMEPKTGEILAIASHPTFDLQTRDNIGNAYFHYGLQAKYEPGSTFKTIAAAAALDTGLMTEFSTVFCHNGQYSEPGVKLIKDEGPLAAADIGTILAKSSNIGIFKVASELGPERFEDYIRKFGFLTPTDLGVGSGHSGSMQDVYNRQDMSRISYGYSIDVTPLQMVAAYAAVANGGLLMQPTLLKRVIGSDGTVIAESKPTVVRRVISETTAAKVREMLAGVVTPQATGKRAVVHGFSVGGKTGTKSLTRTGGGYEGPDERNVASFIGMMPAHNPAFVCLVVLDDPQITGVKRFGGVLAAPVFARVATRAAQCLNLVPDRPTAGVAISTPSP